MKHVFPAHIIQDNVIAFTWKANIKCDEIKSKGFVGRFMFARYTFLDINSLVFAT